MLTSPTITLKPTGAQMPQIGFGTWKHYGSKATDAVYTGLKVGYKLIDCACGECVSAMSAVLLPGTLCGLRGAGC